MLYSNAVFCEDCVKRVPLFRTLRFTKIPQLLLIQLKRFKVKEEGDSFIMTKTDRHISFPEMIALDRYMHRVKGGDTDQPIKVGR